MSRQSGIEYKARIGMKSDGLSFGIGSGSGGGGGLGGSHGPAGDGGSGQGGPDDKGGGSGGSSLGFIAAYALVLGLSGYVVMTDDSATAGGFSLFAESEEEEDSFRVRSVWAKNTGTTFDWSRKTGSGHRRWEGGGLKVGDLFAAAESANVYGQKDRSGSSAFLLPGQLNDILSSTPATDSYSSYSWGSGSQNRSAAAPQKVVSVAPKSRQPTRVASGSTPTGSQFKRYSFETPKPAGVVPINEKNSSEAVVPSLTSGGISVFKGRVQEVTGYDGYDWRLSIRFISPGAAKPAELRLTGAFDPVKLGVRTPLSWSSETSTLLYQLEPGARKGFSWRGRELLGALLRREDRKGSAGFSLTSLRKAIKHAASQRSNVYVIRNRTESAGAGTLKAILIQDLRARSWKVFNFSAPTDNSRVVKSRFDGVVS